MNRLSSEAIANKVEWIWDGLLARRNITLLTSRWKSGKTTLVAGLLRALAEGTEFLGLPCVTSRAIVVSEELPEHWQSRQDTMSIGPHAELVSRPFMGRPTPQQWDELVLEAEERARAGTLDLFVVDPLATFLPGRSESDPGTLLDLLQPLRRLAGYGVAVLVLHHPRKQAAEEGSRARGSGALLGFVDVIVELERLSRLKSDVRRRKLVVFSRHANSPPPIAYEWTPGTAEFLALGDVHESVYQENWLILEQLLDGRKSGATLRELQDEWPPDQEAPHRSVIYRWLARALREKRIERSGDGTRNYPYRYELAVTDKRDSSKRKGETTDRKAIENFFKVVGKTLDVS
jgi:hypothetical protein